MLSVTWKSVGVFFLGSMKVAEIGEGVRDNLQHSSM